MLNPRFRLRLRFLLNIGSRTFCDLVLWFGLNLLSIRVKFVEILFYKNDFVLFSMNKVKQKQKISKAYNRVGPFCLYFIIIEVYNTYAPLTGKITYLHF